MKYIYLLIGILMIGTVSAYVADTHTNVELIFDETTYYVADTHTNVELILDVTPPDTCTYSGSGDWEVNCADYCNITTNTIVRGNSIIVAGTGYFNIQANISTDAFIFIGANCKILNPPFDGNELRIWQ